MEERVSTSLPPTSPMGSTPTITPRDSPPRWRTWRTTWSPAERDPSDRDLSLADGRTRGLVGDPELVHRVCVGVRDVSKPGRRVDDLGDRAIFLTRTLPRAWPAAAPAGT